MCNWNEVANVKKYCKTTKKNEAVSRNLKKTWMQRVAIKCKLNMQKKQRFEEETQTQRATTNANSKYKNNEALPKKMRCTLIQTQG